MQDKSAAIYDLKDKFLDVVSYAHMRGEEDPIPPEVYLRILRRSLPDMIAGGAPQPAGSPDLSEMMDPTPPTADGATTPAQLPLTLAQVPRMFIGQEGRRNIGKALFGEALSLLMPLFGASVPAILALRAALLPRLVALQTTAPSETLAGMIAGIRAAASPVQAEPMSAEDMRALTKCTVEHHSDELQKVIGALMAQGWWKDAKASAIRRGIGDVQHGGT